MKQYIQILISIVIAGVLIWTRTINLGWGLPYPMHPDERNIADAIIKLRCDTPPPPPHRLLQLISQNISLYLTHGESAVPDTGVECMNPHFFAYGQLSIYAGSVVAWMIHRIQDISGVAVGQSPGFATVVMALRMLSAISSIITVILILWIIHLLTPVRRPPWIMTVGSLLAVFSPVLIQFAHFGTTESLLTMWYALITLIVLRMMQSRHLHMRYIILCGVVCGLAIGTKASSVIFLSLPILLILVRWFISMMRPLRRLAAEIHSPPGEGESPSDTPPPHVALTHRIPPTHLTSILREMVGICLTGAFSLVLLVSLSAVASIFSAPHNIISLREFLGSIRYEGEVGLGVQIPFYTRQFLLETPILFQLHRVLPYALGLPVFALSIYGLITAPYRRSFNIIRLAIVLYGVSTFAWYAKWTRFLAPVYPLMVVSAVLGLMTLAPVVRRLLRRTRLAGLIAPLALLSALLPGIGYTAVYARTDVRFTASDWVYAHIPAGSKVLSETANVVDIPMPDVSAGRSIPDGYGIQYLSFNFYDLETDPRLARDLADAIESADYVFVPSRRLYYNHTCVDLSGRIDLFRHGKSKCDYLAKRYPKLTRYYQGLFGGSYGIRQVAEFSAYPRIEVLGVPLLVMPDEESEETFTVFDHPVIRVYKKVTANSNNNQYQ